MAWFKATRKRVVQQNVYVKAESAAVAKERIDNLDWDGETGDETVRYYKISGFRKVEGIPRWLWEELGYPDDEKIAQA